MDFSCLTLKYGVCYGKGDGSDMMDWEVELTEQQAAAFRRAVMTGTELEDVPELEDIPDQAYSDIADEETAIGLETGDEYTAECMGETPVDADTLNELVEKKDPHALAFFGLTSLTEEELADWDANELEDLPLVKDFCEDFVPESPFDCGWDLSVEFPQIDDFAPEDEDIEAYLREVLTAGDAETAAQVVDVWDYSGDFERAAFSIAVQVGCEAYVAGHCVKGDPELLTYAESAGTDSMRALLLRLGTETGKTE